MCKITSMELYGTELDMPVVRDFELWFQTAFGVSDREAWWVLAHYVSRRSAEPDGEVIAHLLSLLDEGSAVFDWPLDQVGTITLPGMLIVPAESVVKSDVQAAGVIFAVATFSSKELFEASATTFVFMVVCVRPLFLARGGCIVGSVHTLGDIRTEGDLIVAGELHCEGIWPRDHLCGLARSSSKALAPLMAEWRLSKSSTSPAECVTRARWKSKAAFAAKPTNPHGHWLWGFFICSSFGGFFSMQLSMT
jgi:hypothetical protein